MPFKADVVDDGGRTTLRLAGRLDLEQSSELLRLYDQTQGAMRLDLTDLLSADAAGLDALRTLRSRGAGLVGLTPYLGLQLAAKPPGRPHVTGQRKQYERRDGTTERRINNARMKGDR